MLIPENSESEINIKHTEELYKLGIIYKSVISSFCISLSCIYTDHTCLRFIDTFIISL